MMANTDALSVTRAYHRAWTSKNFPQAIDLLAANLLVEVPVNDYPTIDLFAQALTAFGGMVKSVTLLGEFTQGNEVVLLYDMDVERLGAMRIAEHFTVVNGKIARIRQIHDTAALRAAGFVAGG